MFRMLHKHFHNIIGIFMKKIISLFFATFLLMACSAEIGSEEWCAEMKEKPKGDWTASEAKDFAKHCLF